MLMLAARDIEKTSRFLERVGLYPTIAAVGVAVFVLAYLIRAVENYVRHLHHKPYLPYSNPRFILSTIGGILVADGFVIGFFFEGRLQLHVATVTISAGLLCFIVSVAMSVVPLVRSVRRVRSAARRTGTPGDAAPRDDDGPGAA